MCSLQKVEARERVGMDVRSTIEIEGDSNGEGGGFTCIFQACDKRFCGYMAVFEHVASEHSDELQVRSITH